MGTWETMILSPVPHPFAHFANGWESTILGCPTLAAVILSERSESKDLLLVLLRLGWETIPISFG